MYLAALVLSLITTYGMCFFVFLTRWMIDSMGPVYFAIILIVNSVVFMLALGGKKNG